MLLVLTKWGIVPILDWQETQVNELTLLQKKIARTEHAISRETINKKELEKLSLIVEKNRTLLYPYQEENAFHLTIQKEIEQLLKKFQLTPKNIGWLATKYDENTNVYQHQLQVRFEGGVVRVPDFQMAVSQREKWVEVERLLIGLKRQNSKSLGNTKGLLELNFYMEGE